MVSYEYLLKGGKLQGLTGERVLERVSANFSQIKDFQAELEITSTMPNVIKNETVTEKNRYSFLHSDSHKIEKYNDAGELW